MSRVLSSDPIAFVTDGPPAVSSAETTIEVVTVNGSTIAGIDASLAGKVGEAPNDGQLYARQSLGWSPFSLPVAPAGLVTVDSLADLPAAVAGVRTLAASTAYYVTTTIDLLGDRLVLSDATVLLGTSSETAILRSTGLNPATPFITAAHGGPNPIQNLQIEGVGIAFDIDGLGGVNAAFDWTAFNLVNCGSVGTIRDITNLVINDSAWINTGGLTLDGTVQTAAWFQTIWTLPIGSGATAVNMPGTLTVTRRLRWTYSPMFVPPGCTGFNVAAVATTFPIAESFGILFGNFTGGGTYLTGTNYADKQTVIQSTLGLTNSSPTAHYYQIGNAAATAIAMAGTFYKIAGSPVAGTYISKFTISGNRATYDGAVPRFFRLACSVAVTAGANNIIALRFAINGTTLADTEQRTTANSGGRAESMTTLGIALMNPGQYIEVFAANLSGTTSIVVTDMQVTVTATAG